MVIRKNAFYCGIEGKIDSEAWLSHIAVERPHSRLRLVRNAVALSKLTSAHRFTPFGSNCLQQGLEMADLLLDLTLDEDTLCAALLYYSVCYAELDLKVVEQHLNSNVTKLLKGALRMNNITHFLELKNLKQDQVETFRKMLFSMADDMRVVLLKLAERVTWMRSVKNKKIRTISTRNYAKEALAIYASLANRLGIHMIRYELEDLAMHQLAPRLYKKIAQLLRERLMDREKYMQEIVLAIEVTLPKVEIQGFKITSRVKNLYGICRKMHLKKVSLKEVYDLNAIRIIVNTVEECYRALKVIRTLWSPVQGELDDYIQSPKENNYRSIHLAVYGVNGKIIEVQIRTFEMDQESEHGLAAHWEYKESISHKTDYHTKIAWLRQVLTWQKELVRNGMRLMPELTATLDDRIYVLSRSGDIIDLAKGATVLDFAYHINPEMGHYCQQVRVDGTIQPLSYILNTGEQVEVTIGESLSITWDWLNPDLGYLYTAHAKAKVLHWFQQKEYDQQVVTGKLFLEKGCRQLGVYNVDPTKVAHTLHFSSKEELLAALGSGEVSMLQILWALQPYTMQKKYLPSVNSSPFMLEDVKYSDEDQSVVFITAIQVITSIHISMIEPILNALQTQEITLTSLAAVYNDNDQKTYVTLHVKPISASQIASVTSILKSIDPVSSIKIL